MGQIRILPEWNVKDITETVDSVKEAIRILPEWNVKNFYKGMTKEDATLESYQSGM